MNKFKLYDLLIKINGVVEPRIKNKGLLQFPGRTTKKLTP